MPQPPEFASTTMLSYTELARKYKSTYRGALVDLLVHMCLFAGGSWLMSHLWRAGSWWSAVAVPLVGLMNVKTFIIFHDCGHNSFTPNRTLNTVIGIVAGIFVATPFSWNFNHNTHHLTNGNYENKYEFRYNETILHSLEEYKRMSPMQRRLYRFFKHPFVFFTFGPITKFLLIERFRAVRLLLSATKKLSVKNRQAFTVIESVINNAGIAVWFYFLHTHEVLLPFMIGNMIGSSCGVMLFHSQHGFNPSYVVDDKTWTKKDNGLLGSSFVLVPPLFKYFTGGIEYHHIHHMNAKIPGYNLQKYHEEVVADSDRFDKVVMLSFGECYNNFWLTLHDDDAKRYVTFKEADQVILQSEVLALPQERQKGD